MLDEDLDQKNRKLIRLIQTDEFRNLDKANELLLLNEHHISGQVRKIYSNYKENHKDYCGIEFDDLMQEARISFFKSAKTYDENKDTKFTTYAFRGIELALKSYIRDCLPGFEQYLSEPGVQRVFLDKELEESDDRILDITSADELLCPPDNVPRKDPTGYIATMRILLIRLANEIYELSDRDYKYLIYRFGLRGNEEHSLKETAKNYNLYPSKAMKIETNAIEKLRDRMGVDCNLLQDVIV